MLLLVSEQVRQLTTQLSWLDRRMRPTAGSKPQDWALRMHRLVNSAIHSWFRAYSKSGTLNSDELACVRTAANIMGTTSIGWIVVSEPK